MATDVVAYTTRELSSQTLPDFEKLLETHPAPGAFSCWCLYNHRTSAEPEATKKQSSAKRAASNRREKRTLVANGCSHGIIVYAGAEPVGWCQYGPSGELPRIDANSGYRKLSTVGEAKRLWRITCFVVDKEHRQRGVAGTALKAALAAIQQKGGGVVEAFPITHWGAYAEYRGTVSMFKKEGFEVIGPLGKNNVLVRRTI
jgi:ribosomal protein S18 acetylase RimI-like enzyme